MPVYEEVFSFTGDEIATASLIKGGHDLRIDDHSFGGVSLPPHRTFKDHELTWSIMAKLKNVMTKA